MCCDYGSPAEEYAGFVLDRLVHSLNRSVCPKMPWLGAAMIGIVLRACRVSWGFRRYFTRALWIAVFFGPEIMASIPGPPCQQRLETCAHYYRSYDGLLCQHVITSQIYFWNVGSLISVPECNAFFDQLRDILYASL